MPSFDYDIVVLPEAEIADKAIRSSKELEPLGTHFALGAEHCLPHVSLYMLQLRDEDLAEVEKRLAAIAANTPKLHLEADEYNQAGGYIDVGYQRTEAAEQLQQQVIAALNPLRDGLRRNDQYRLRTATGTLRENIETYGYRSVGELFRPHLTFTRFTRPEPISLEDMGAPTAFSGRFTKLAICQLGDHGTCARKIKEFGLQ